MHVYAGTPALREWLQLILEETHFVEAPREAAWPALLDLDVDLFVVDAEASPEGFPWEEAGLSDRVFVFSAASFKEVLAEVLRLARRLDRLVHAMEALWRREERLHRLQAALGRKRRAPTSTRATVRFAAGASAPARWMEDAVELAGGRVLAVDEEGPADVLLVPAREEGGELQVTDLAPGKEARRYAIDRAWWKDGPGPSIYRLVELVAAALHPGHPALASLDVSAAELVELGDRGEVMR